MTKYRPKVYDCFPFFNELDLLELRFNELDDVVDKFVLVEASKTHSSKPKPLYFKENAERFERFSSKIIHISIDFTNAAAHTCGDSRKLDTYQRNQIVQGLGDCDPEDYIILSDVDEIPHPRALLEAMQNPGICILEQLMFYYYVNMIDKSSPLWLCGTRVFKKKVISGCTPQEIREGPGLRIPNGGWHFSFLGGVERIKEKIESFRHQEYNMSYFTDEERLTKVINEGGDLFGRKGHAYESVPVDDTFPKYLVENYEKYKKYIKETDSLDSQGQKETSFLGSLFECVCDRSMMLAVYLKKHDVRSRFIDFIKKKN